MTVPKTKMPDIPAEEKSPLVSQMLGIIEQQTVVLQLLVEEVQLLRDEIARLKNKKPMPRITPSKLEKGPQPEENRTSGDKRPGSVKGEKTKNLARQETVAIAPEQIPPRFASPYLQPLRRNHSYNHRISFEMCIKNTGSFFTLLICQLAAYRFI
jgi:hypothetical protein